MSVKVAAAPTTCLQWSAAHPKFPRPQKRRRSRGEINPPCSYKPPQRIVFPAFLSGTQSTKLHRSKSCELWTFPKTTLRRACSANFHSFEEFSKQMQDRQKADVLKTGPEIIIHEPRCRNNNTVETLQEVVEDSPWREMVVESTIERRANSVELPLSLRIIKRKLKWEEAGWSESGESAACCSVKKAFSTMVFMIEELHSFSLRMREVTFQDDVQGIIRRVQKELHASFVWLFQRVFSRTPTMMVYVMLLMANFTVYSMGTNAAIAAPPPTAASEELSSVAEARDEKLDKFDSTSAKTFRVSSGSGGKIASVGGNDGGGGGKVRPVASGTDGNGWFDGSERFRTYFPDRVSEFSSFGSSRKAESTREDEMGIWNSILEEAERMRDEPLDHETMRRLVAPLDVKIEKDDYEEYFRMELVYQTVLAKEGNNSLLLANYAQFLYLVAHDYDRAEEYFKRAISMEPADAEAFNKYANFLWRVRDDLWAAEETFLEAISADPTNSHYAANYANFLWNTGGEDTCFPLNSPETPPQESD